MSTITYFEKAGPVNTDNALALAATRAKDLSIETIILASSSGATAQKAVTIFPRGSLVIVTHSTEKREPDSHQRQNQQGGHKGRLGIPATEIGIIVNQ